MIILKILFFPIYFPILIIVNILKVLGIIFFMDDVMDFFE